MPGFRSCLGRAGAGPFFVRARNLVFLLLFLQNHPIGCAFFLFFFTPFHSPHEAFRLYSPLAVDIPMFPPQRPDPPPSSCVFFLGGALFQPWKNPHPIPLPRRFDPSPLTDPPPWKSRFLHHDSIFQEGGMGTPPCPFSFRTVFYP